MSDLLKQLANIVGEQHLLTDPADLTEYGQDWSKIFTPNAIAAVRPANKEQVQQVVLWANENKVALVPSGGRTGLSGGACATSGEVVLSL
ncbi:MAG: FAD-binding protein, partial [Kangiellaceae bacterium]|nr:FAD-binding protein [Kangiellaceae bacterium]